MPDNRFFGGTRVRFLLTLRLLGPSSLYMVRICLALVFVLTSVGCARTVGLGEECEIPQEGDGRWEQSPQCDDGLVCSDSNTCSCPADLVAYGDDCVSPGIGVDGDFCPGRNDRFCSEGLVCMSKDTSTAYYCRPLGSAVLGDPCQPEHGDCADGLICDSEPVTCIEPGFVPQFNSCIEDEACAEGLSCRRYSPSSKLMCLIPGQLDDPCNSSPDCAVGLTCTDRSCQ